MNDDLKLKQYTIIDINTFLSVYDLNKAKLEWMIDETAKTTLENVYTIEIFQEKSPEIRFNGSL